MLNEEKLKHIYKLLYSEGMICNESHEINKYIDDINLTIERNGDPTGYCKYSKRKSLLLELENSKLIIIDYIKQSAINMTNREFDDLLAENIKNNSYGHYQKTTYASICTIIKKLRHHEVKVIDIAWAYSMIGFINEKYK